METKKTRPLWEERRKKTKVKALVENVDVAVEREEQNKKTEVLQVIAEKKTEKYEAK